MRRAIRITDVSTAVEIYYQHPELSTDDVIRLFGCSPSSATRLKAKARALQKEKGIKTFSDLNVNTKIAYQAWGLDIAELEKLLLKYRKIQKGLAT